MKITQIVKSWFGSTTLDGSPAYAVAQEPHQWFQKWTDGERRPASGLVAAAEGGIDAYGQSFALMPGYHYKRDGNGGKSMITTSALSRLLRSPNGYQTQSDFKLFLGRQLMQHGNAVCVAVRNDRFEVSSLHPLPFGSYNALVSPETKELYYAIQANPLMPGEQTYVVPARDVLHIKLYTPNNPLVGVSPLSYAAMSLAANTALGAHMATFFNNMARPSFILSTDQVLTSAHMQQLRSAWENQSAQMNSGGVPILGAGLKATPLGLNAQDSQLIEAFKLTVEDIGRALRIPLPLMGVSTQHSTTEALMSFWLSTGLGFFINHIEVALDKFFALPADEFVEFDAEQLLRVDFIGRVDGLSKATINGIMSPNEARSRLELPAVENGDSPTVQQQQVPLNLLTQLHAAQIARASTPVSQPTAKEEPTKEVSDLPKDKGKSGFNAELAARLVMSDITRKNHE